MPVLQQSKPVRPFNYRHAANTVNSFIPKLPETLVEIVLSLPITEQNVSMPVVNESRERFNIRIVGFPPFNPI